MLTGGQPFAAASTEEIRRRHQEARPIPPSARVQGLSRGFDAVFTKLTFREPLLRYRSAADLLEDLDRLENGDTAVAERELKKITRRAQATPPDPGFRRRRSPRRRS
jgi:serine/threonine-protein kinase